MPYRFWLKLAAVTIAVTLLAAMVKSWRVGRRDRARLAAELSATKQLLAAAGARQHDRDAQLVQTLATLDAQKRATITPSQIIRQLQKNIPLPVPIALQVAGASSVDAVLGPPAANRSAAATPAEDPSAGVRHASPAPAASPSNQSNQNPTGGAVIPAADLKPLYDFTLDCQACQAKLSAAQSDLTDEKSKTAALTKARDDALRIAKGGSGWRRVTRAAKWFLLGAAAGAVIAKAH